VALAPAEFSLHARNPARDVTFGGSNLVFCAVGGPAFVSDLDRGRRPGNSADFRDYVRLIGALDVIHQEGGGPLEPTDLPVETRHLDMYRTLAVELDKTWQCLGFGSVAVSDALSVLEIVRGVDRDTLVREPSAMTVINTNSPLRLDGPMGDGLMEMAANGQPVVATPFTLAGAMSPVTLAGALAQQHAEALAGIALCQIVRPGAPVMYGGFTSNVDMKSGSPAFGTPEYTKAAQASGQLARHIGVPFRSSNVNASNLVDAQAAYESANTLQHSMLAGVNFMLHAAGWLEGGLTVGYEKFILDADQVGMLQVFADGVDMSDNGQAMDAIREVGPGAHFLGCAHTQANFETAFYRSNVADNNSFEQWEADGAQDAAQRANAIWKRMLAGYEAPGIDPGVDEALLDYIARRKAERPDADY